MTTMIDIKKAINSLLKMKYPTYKRYGIEVTEGYERPSFFVDLRLDGRNDATANIEKKDCSCTITYFARKIDDIDNLTKVEEIQQLLSGKDSRNRKKRMCLYVNDRYIPVTKYHFGYTGEKNNILQIGFTISYFDFCQEEEDRQLMQEMKMKERLER
ncbi:hypothetical protein lbkm_3833 [Lachnospiraceae bacterium KM106-2]|nr:hypothetical protein lbkm_3833 [Lachnospiraceae bacterium KM106-2]